MSAANPARPATSSENRPVRRWLGRSAWLAAAFAVVALIQAARAFLLPGDAAALKHAVVQATGLAGVTRVQVSAGPALLGGAALACRWLPEVPAEARAALAAVRRAGVGVYTLTDAPSAESRAAMVQAAEKVLSGNEWRRTVLVNDGPSTVLIFTRGDERAEAMEICVLVCDGADLVVVSATANGPALFELAARAGVIHGEKIM